MSTDEPGEATGGDDEEGRDGSNLEIIGAFEMPRSFDFARGGGAALAGNAGNHLPTPRLHGDVGARGALAIDRLRLVESRLMRLSLFRPTPFGQARNAKAQRGLHLTPLDALSGSGGGTKTVFGCLVSDEDGRWSLEDASGGPPLPLNLSNAAFAPGLLPEGSCVVAEGRVDRHGHHAAAGGGDARAGAFVVSAIGQPPPEDRASACAAAQGRPVFGGGRPSRAGYTGDDLAWDSANADTSIAVLSNVYLDLPDNLPNGTWEKLTELFGAYDGMGAAAPSLIVLMGDFVSPGARRRHAASSLLAVLREGFSRFGKLFAKHKHLVRHATVLVVPGPCDPTPSRLTLPRMPFIASVQAACMRPLATIAGADDTPPVIFTTSPARVRFGDRELVFHRHNVCEQMLSCSLAKVVSDGPKPSNLLRHTAATLLQQSHLSPVPLSVQPVHWSYDHALYLWPSPHLLVLGDQTIDGGRQGVASIGAGGGDGRAHVVANAGCFQGGEFLLYRPVEGAVELCEV